MASNYLPRTSIDISRYATVDAELKSLKLLSRRIQSTMSSHLTELQTLQRLFYKNKNQHRGALFWRNISEVRRYAEHLEKLNLLTTTNVFRDTFYGKNNPAPGKGPWTHVPDCKTLCDFTHHCDIALKLSEKTSVICLDAYRMFHRSMQSGAFLQVLLMFIAIASRIRSISLELVDIFMSMRSCATRIQGVVLANHATGDSAERTEDVDGSEDMADLAQIHNFGARSSKETVLNLPAETFVKKHTAPIARIHIEHKRKGIPTEPEKQVDQVVKKKKRKVAKNEIDDIFGF